MQGANKLYFSHETSVLDEGCSIGEKTCIWHFTHVMSGSVIGVGCNIGQNVFVGKGVVLGNNVKIQNNVSMYEGVTCQDDVFIGPSVVFTNVTNPRAFICRKTEFKKTTICKGASIGANATIICGITVGEYAFIGAGTVVTKNISPYALVVGNPAKHVGWVGEYGTKLTFNEKNIATCSVTGHLYKLSQNLVTRIQ
jgi:UDP-2-acetamido-3-amino-2,3-dideoxy-glucuronate N-acetyltransferase